MQALVRYLEKEDKAQNPPATPLFFDQNQQEVPSEAVVAAINGNTSKLGKRDAKYFMLTLSPSQHELQHIGNAPSKLMAFARQVMAHYAAGFDRGITADELLYFGKIEQGRTFQAGDPAVRSGHVPAGTPKPGLQTHVHIIVS